MLLLLSMLAASADYLWRLRFTEKPWNQHTIVESFLVSSSCCILREGSLSQLLHFCGASIFVSWRLKRFLLALITEHLFCLHASFMILHDSRRVGWRAHEGVDKGVHLWVLASQCLPVRWLLVFNLLRTVSLVAIILACLNRSWIDDLRCHALGGASIRVLL